MKWIIAGLGISVVVLLAGCEPEVTITPAVTQEETVLAESPTAVSPVTPAIPPPVTPEPVLATPTSEPAPLGSRERPVPLGTGVEIQTNEPTQHWELTVLDTVPDAEEVILAENIFNDPPEPEHQFYMVRVRAKYLGPDSSMLLADVTLKTLGASSVAYSGLDCGVIPDELDSFAEIFTGGQIEGYECWQIASSDADSLVMFADIGFINPARVWFELK